MTIIATYKHEGPYTSTREEVQVESLGQFIFTIRSAFEDWVDAILVVENNEAVGIWLAEPDVDYDYETNSYYEIRGRAGAEYCLYRPDRRNFWSYVGYHFGIKYVPADIGFIARKNSKVPTFI